MSLAIRAASLTDDQPQLIGILERNFPGRQKIHFEWRHQANPAGPGWSWVACDRTDAIVAMASVFPRNVWVNGKAMICGQVGEFAVDAPYRSLGPAVMMQRATFTPVDSGEVAFCYDCPPHDQGMSTFVRLGMNANTEVTRYALPLKSDEFLTKKIGNGAWTKPIVSAANLIISIQGLRPRARGLEIRRFDGPFDDEFSHLDARVPSSGMIRAIRSADGLNWRYGKNPAWKARVFVARQAGELVGFIAYVLFDKRASIVDLFGLGLEDVGISLLEALIEEGRREDWVCVEGYCSDGSELNALFRRAGFRPRERSARVVAYERPGGPAGTLLNSGLRWAFSQVEVMI